MEIQIHVAVKSRDLLSQEIYVGNKLKRPEWALGPPYLNALVVPTQISKN